MAMTVAQLTTVPATTDIFNQMIVWLVNMGLPANNWRKGGVARSVLMAVAVSFTALALTITNFASSAFLTTATGDWLTLVAQYIYGVARIQATQASGTILATNAGGGVYTWNPGDLVVQDTVTLNTYTNSALTTLNPGAVSQPIAMVCTIFGTAGNANPNEITNPITSVPNVTFVQPSPFVATNAQSDADLVTACLAKLGALSMLGPRGAYAYAVLSALNNGAPVNVNRYTISPSSSTGQVSIVLASPSGPVTSSDLAAVQANIEAVARPDTATATTTSAVVVTPSALTMTVWAKNTPGLDATTLYNLVAAALTTNVSKYPIGGIVKAPSTQGYLYDETIRGWAQAAHPSIYAVDTASPVDLPIAPGSVVQLVFNSGTIGVRFTTVQSS